jgi:hypothetical protein
MGRKTSLELFESSFPEPPRSKICWSVPCSSKLGGGFQEESGGAISRQRRGRRLRTDGSWMGVIRAGVRDEGTGDLSRPQCRHAASSRSAADALAACPRSSPAIPRRFTMHGPGGLRNLIETGALPGGPALRRRAAPGRLHRRRPPKPSPRRSSAGPGPLQRQRAIACERRDAAALQRQRAVLACGRPSGLPIGQDHCDPGR